MIFKTLPPSSERLCPSQRLGEDMILARPASKPANKLSTLSTVCYSVHSNHHSCQVLLPSKHPIQVRQTTDISNQKAKQSGRKLVRSSVGICGFLDFKAWYMKVFILSVSYTHMQHIAPVSRYENTPVIACRPIPILFSFRKQNKTKQNPKKTKPKQTEKTKPRQLQTNLLFCFAIIFL